MSSLFSDIISHLKCHLSPSDHERVKHDLLLRESTFKSEKDQISHQLATNVRYNLTLSKELEYWKRNHGDLILNQHDSEQKLTELNSELELLRSRLGQQSSFDLGKLKKERDEFELKIVDAKKEVEILRKQCQNWSRENGDLVVGKRELEEKLAELNSELERLRERLGEVQSSSSDLAKLKKERDEFEVEFVETKKEVESLRKECQKCSRENGELKGEIASLKKVKEGLEMVVKCKKKELEISYENKKKVEIELEAVKIAATANYRGLQNRVTDLEGEVKKLIHSSREGPQVDGTIKVEKRQERNDKLLGRRHVCETAVQETIPCTPKTSLASPAIFEITDSDSDEEEIKGSKRKLSSFKASNEIEESANSGTNRSKQLKGSGDESVNASTPLAASVGGGTSISLINDVKQYPGDPKQLEEKFGVELDGKSEGLLTRSVVDDCEDGIQDESDDSWEYEADMLKALEKDTELCMKAVCALYRQHSSQGRSTTGSSASKYRVLNEFSTIREASLAKFLVNGDQEGRLKRSVAELEKFDPNGAVNCRNIAFNHSRLLFEMYKSEADPFFAP